jgi:hypothetical protein
MIPTAGYFGITPTEFFIIYKHCFYRLLEAKSSSFPKKLAVFLFHRFLQKHETL